MVILIHKYCCLKIINSLSSISINQSIKQTFNQSINLSTDQSELS